MTDTFINLLMIATLVAGIVYLRSLLKRMQTRLGQDLDKVRKRIADSGQTVGMTSAFHKSNQREAEAEPEIVFPIVMKKDVPDFLFKVPLPVPKRGGPFFLTGMHKSGTVLMNSMMEEVAQKAAVPFVDLPAALFAIGVPIKEVRSTSGVFGVPGICFGGLRSAWVGDADLALVENGKAVALVRDPRDILVSLYFSVAKSHTIPDSGPLRETMLKARDAMQNADIDAWAILSARGLAAEMERWAAWVARHPEQVKVFRYEDVIFQKQQWLRDIDKWFGWGTPKEVLDQIATKHDIRPTDEDASRHIRKVAPGDHKEKLKPETIAQLNEILREPAAKFG